MSVTRKPSSATQPADRRWFRRLRVLILSVILAVVALRSWYDRVHSTQWRDPLRTAIYPIIADASDATRSYVASIDAERFQSIDRFFAREAQRYDVALANPIQTQLESTLQALPPQRSADSGTIGTIIWSLKLRYWAWRMTYHAPQRADIRIFVLYRDPSITPVVPHSLGITEGLIGVVYAFATSRMNGDNDVVIAHELLHTLGATDKYAIGTDAPRFPDGYGDPGQFPLYPQRTAELMGGRRMLSEDRWQQAQNLTDVVVGPATAREIHWLKYAR